jgi:5'-3' exoribonuclease 1
VRCVHGNFSLSSTCSQPQLTTPRAPKTTRRLYKLVQPGNILYLAVDGVAPRAKMNQQRSRRFRSAKEAEQTAMDIMARDGVMPQGTAFDSNCITPGTDFMLKLSLALQKWVEFKMETDPFWSSGATVVVSGPDVPGEGEHKVMDFIREEREKYNAKDPTSHYAPEQTHVLYGLDADLIMLGLVTHEPNFMLLREKMSVVMAGRGRDKGRKKKDMLEYSENDFEVLELKSLRELLSIQFRRFGNDNILKVPYDLDRVIDDFVFMCMMVGNDFLPHVPHLEIDNGAISLMMTSYVDLLAEWGDYLTDKEQIHPDRFEQFVHQLAVYEEEHFKRRGFEENEPGWKLTTELENEDTDFYGTHYSGKPTPDVAVPANRKGAVPPPTNDQPDSALPLDNIAFRRDHPGDMSRSYRDFYYNNKLKWPVTDKEHTLFMRRSIVRDYIEGLHWNLNYYHNGCMSWEWFFPYLYAPLATDLVNLDEFYGEDSPSNDRGFKTFPFEKGEPFPSLGQLLSVLPPQSSSLLPKPIGELMLHPSSPLIQYYPQEFTSDANGKRQSWEAVVQIPFIEAKDLLGTLNQVLEADAKAGEDDGLLTKGERRRNIRGTARNFAPPLADMDPEKREAIVRQAKASTQVNSGPREPSNSRPAGRSGGRGQGRGSGRGRGGGRGSLENKRQSY